MKKIKLEIEIDLDEALKVSSFLEVANKLLFKNKNTPTSIVESSIIHRFMIEIDKSMSEQATPDEILEASEQ